MKTKFVIIIKLKEGFIIKGIYKITNKINNKVYIGKSKNIKKRHSEHRNELRKNEHVNNYLQNAWNKYGEENFEFSILEECETDKDLNDREIFFIKEYKSHMRDCGYNLSTGGEGGSLSEETKNKIRNTNRGKGTNLSYVDIKNIKLSLACCIDRKEIIKKYNISKAVVDQIAMGKSFSYVLSELNETIYNLKKKLINERNDYIIKLFNEGNRIVDIVNITGYSESIVEKCVYNRTKSVEETKNKYQLIYDKVYELYSNGENKFSISKILDISPSTVSRYLNGENNPYKDLPFKKIIKEFYPKIISMYYNDKMSQEEIAKVYNVRHTTISNIINNHKYVNTEVI